MEQRSQRRANKKLKKRLSPISNEFEELNEDNIPSIPSDDDDIITFSFEDGANDEMKLNETIVANQKELTLFKTPTKKSEKLTTEDELSITSTPTITPSSSNVIDTVLEFENNSSVNTFRRSQSQSPQYPLSHRFDYSLNSHRDYSPRSVSIDVMNEGSSENVAPYICESASVSPLKQSVNNRNNLILQSLTGNVADIPFDDELEYDEALHFKLIDPENIK